MARPQDVEAVDTMIWFPTPTAAAARVALFKDEVSLPEGREPIEYTIEQMDRFAVGRAVVDVELDPVGAAAIERHPDRFIPSYVVDPNSGMDSVRKIEAMHRGGIRAVSLAPSMLAPPVPIDDKRMYPAYAKCVELDLPVFVTVGVPGPSVPMAAQRVDLLDEVCWFFPELRIVMRHGGEPWVDLAVKLMQKWPNLYYSTSAFSPRRYPNAIIDFANTSTGADKVLFAGYYAVGLTWERIFRELEELPLKDDVWPRFLRDNALSVLGLA